MATTKGTLDLRVWSIAILAGWIVSAAALARDAAASPDMRLWSFGDCERKYPRADSQEYQECMRVVGSPEAKDLRAQRSCEDSYSNDPKGLNHCVATYQQTKQRPTTTNTDTTLSPEMTLKVQAIAAAAVEQHETTPSKTPSAAAVGAESATTRAGSSLTSLVLVGALGVLLLGVGGAVILRGQS